MSVKNPPAKLTVTNSGYFRVGDIIRSTTTGKPYVVTATHASSWSYGPRRLRLWRMVWNWLRGRGWQRVVYAGHFDRQHTLRVFRWRPSPLPRRLP